MAFFTVFTKFRDLCVYYHLVNSISIQSAYACVASSNYAAAGRKRWMSSGGADSPQSEFRGSNAYELLQVSETSSFSEIKASFRKLAKETHPDLSRSETDSSASKRFIQILAAYEILSDVEKRAHYDRFLLSQRTVVQRHSRQGSVFYKYNSHGSEVQVEVVEWLKWYRYAINDILSGRRVVIGSGYVDVLERDFYSALHAAYYGPEIESLDLLPDCFEAEERSNAGTHEVLHLVSGRDLFGMVRIGNWVRELPHACKPKLNSFALHLSQSLEGAVNRKSSDVSSTGTCDKQLKGSDFDISDAYKDLELHVAGRLVAVARRVPPKSYLKGIYNKELHDVIHVYLTACEELMDNNQGVHKDIFTEFSVGSRILLGTITGLRTIPEEGSCYVYNNCGVNTHMILKHRTLMVKHMHWYQVGDKVSVCECRSTRARLPPSRFWLFEPRCAMHDIGGWYVETYGRDKKGKTVPSQRYWDGIDPNEHLEMRLHPAMYLLALAYRSLDIEDARRRTKNVKDIFEAKIFRFLNWYKKLV